MNKLKKSKIVPSSLLGKIVALSLVVLMVTMDYASAGIMSTLSSERVVMGLIITVVGIALLIYGKGSTDEASDIWVLFIGALVVFAGLGMIGGTSFFNSLKNARDFF